MTVHSVVVPSGELRGKGRYGVLCRITTVWSTPERFWCKSTMKRYRNSHLYLFWWTHEPMSWYCIQHHTASAVDNTPSDRRWWRDSTSSSSSSSSIYWLKTRQGLLPNSALWALACSYTAEDMSWISARVVFGGGMGGHVPGTAAPFATKNASSYTISGVKNPPRGDAVPLTGFKPQIPWSACSTYPAAAGNRTISVVKNIMRCIERLSLATGLDWAKKKN